MEPPVCPVEPGIGECPLHSTDNVGNPLGLVEETVGKLAAHDDRGIRSLILRKYLGKV